MTAAKTNERPGTRAQVTNVKMSATKARAVLDLIRNEPIDEARNILTYTERAAADVIGKLLNSAVANAAHNDGIDPETLFVSACYADEGRTAYRFRPRARGRATKIRKRTCHITLIVSPMPDHMAAKVVAKREAIPGSRAARRRGQEAANRSDRVAKSQQAESDVVEDDAIVEDVTTEEAVITDEVVEETAADETETVETETAEVEVEAPADEAPAQEAPAEDAAADGDDEESN